MHRTTATSSNADASAAPRRIRSLPREFPTIRVGPSVSNNPSTPTAARAAGILHVVILLVLISVPAGLRAQPDSERADGDALLDASRLSELQRRIGSFDRVSFSEWSARGDAAAKRCRLEGESLSCGCVEFEDAGWSVRAARIEVDAKGTRIRKLRATPSGRNWVLYASGARLLREGALELEDVWIFGPARRAFRAETGAIPKDDARPIELRNLAWGDAVPVEAPHGCLEEIPPRKMSRRVLRAARARHQGASWEFRELRQTRPLRVPLGRVRQTGETPVGGPLPPRLTYSATSVELEDWFLDGPSGIGASVAIAPTDWYGGGVALRTEPRRDWLSLYPTRPLLLDGQLLYDASADGPGWMAMGAARRGTPYVHVSGSLEEMSSDRYWRTRRVHRPGLLRPWRRSDAGLSLSSPSHHLQIRAAKWTPSPRVGLERRPPVLDRHLPGEQAELRVRFGMSRRLAEGVELSTDVYHRNMARSARIDDHGTTLATGLAARLGDRGRLFAEGRLAGVVGTRLASAAGTEETDASPRGFDAAATTQLVAGTRGGVTLRGDFPHLTHTLRPTLTAFREVAGAGGTEASDDPFGAPYARTPKWALLAGVLEHSFAWPGFRLGVPTGVVFDGAGFDAALGGASHWFQRLELGWSAFRFRAGGTARFDGRSEGIFARAWYGEGRWSAAVDATTLDAREIALLHADRILGGTAETLRLLQGAHSRGGLGGVVETLSLGWSPGDARIEFRGFSEGAFERAGVGAGWSWQFPRLGWGLGVDGTWAAVGRGWGVSAGLRSAAPRRR